jgi:hypothetical protein
MRLSGAHITVAAALATLAAAVGIADGAAGATALELLQAAPKPVFKAGHGLPRLTRWGWAMAPAVRIELAERWGYALEMGEANAGLAARLADPASEESKLAALAAGDPKRYPLGVLVYRACLNREFQASLAPQAWSPPPEGAPAGAKAERVWSPEAPDAVFEKAAAAAVEPLRRVLAKAPGAVILNGGEYGLGVLGFCRKTWEKDPKALAAKGGRDWFDYISERKARQERIVTEAVRRACPDRSLYIFYYVDGNTYKGENGGWKDWAFDYPPLKDASDLPSASIYYRQFNSGWTGKRDLLSLTLSAVAQHLAEGRPLSYNWVCGGWTQKNQRDEEAFSEPERYLGFLKCYYTAGMIGGVAGYFAYPKGGFAGDVGAEPPSWLRQMMTLAEVHALFSHVEEFLREGDLLPGPDKHRWLKDLPAYEFPTGDAGVRVLARKHRKRPEWLVTAWAADGADRAVSVAIPDLGAVRVEASACGSVYRVALEGGKPAAKPVGAKGLAPTQGMRP